MIAKKTDERAGAVKVTFSLPGADPEEPVYLAGDFNGWNGGRHPLRKRSNGRRSAVVTVPTGTWVAFRYVTASGQWFDDDHADAFVPNDCGGHNGLVGT